LRDDLIGVVHEVGSYFDSRASGGTSCKWKDCRIDVRHRADALVPYTVRMLGNLEMALREESRPGASRKQSGKEEALLVATACSGPPAGRARWTLELLADELVRLTEHPHLPRNGSSAISRKPSTSFRQPCQSQTLRVALEIFRSTESGRQGRHVEPWIKLQGTSQRFLRLV
jgi:hypothetical protein